MPSQQRQSQTGSSSSSTANVVGVHFKIGRKIGEGSFGVIYQGKSKKKREKESRVEVAWGITQSGRSKKKKKKRGGFYVTDDDDCICITFYVLGTNLLNNQPVAVKFEPRKSDAPQLRDEYRAYKILAGSPGVPHAHYYVSMHMHHPLLTLFCLLVTGSRRPS
jgi:casein kinase 1